jgi:hypothetical protein
MKRILSLFCFILLAASLSGQRNADYGIMGGVTCYLGDINPDRLLYSPGLAGGVFYRYNFHPRQSIRADVIRGGLKGSDLDFNNSFQQARAAQCRLWNNGRSNLLPWRYKSQQAFILTEFGRRSFLQV